MIDVSIVIVSYNTKKLLKGCLESIKKHTKEVNYEVIVVDNASRDGSAEEAEKSIKGITSTTGIKNTLIKNKENLGFAKANNQGIKKAKGRYVLLLNSDTKLIEDSLTKMVMWMDSREKVGIATCALTNPNGSLQGTGGYSPTLLRVFSWMTIQDIPLMDFLIKPFHPMKAKSFNKGAGFYKKEKELDWITGAFFLMRREVVDEVGLFDEEYFMYVEEVDYCYRVKNAGWEIWYAPITRVIHYGGASGTSELSVISEFEGIKKFYKKHYPEWQFPILRLLLKTGALGRILLFGILEGKKSAETYSKAFKEA